MSLRESAEPPDFSGQPAATSSAEEFPNPVRLVLPVTVFGKRLQLLPAKHLHDAHVEVGRYKRLRGLCTALLAHQPLRKLTISGASVLRWSHMACGRVDAFLRAGEQTWDYAAAASPRYRTMITGGGIIRMSGRNLSSLPAIRQYLTSGSAGCVAICDEK